MILWKIMENVTRGEKVKGGSSVVNRALELIGKHLGMFGDQPEKPLKLVDLTADQLRELLSDEAPPKPEVLQ
jgi:hypothetical protein